MTRILLVEDDQRLAEILRRGLEDNAYFPVVAYDGEMGLKLALSQDFALVISDIILPKMNGLELCRQIRDLKPELPLLMLTALGTTDDKVEGFDAGADDYLVKPFEIRELLARVKALLKRSKSQTTPEASLITYADLELNTLTKSVFRKAQDIKLTPKEFKLLLYMLQNRERVISRAELSENVWDTHFDTGTNFIDVYINYLRKKIDKPFDKKLIHTKAGMGFILSADPK
ncbi:MAG: response regulator transcription factor [Bacteroidales bacterium]|nr:response regulator transcription factor [Bacteroidales bacterium]